MKNARQIFILKNKHVLYRRKCLLNKGSNLFIESLKQIFQLLHKSYALSLGL